MRACYLKVVVQIRRNEIDLEQANWLCVRAYAERECSTGD